MLQCKALSYCQVYPNTIGLGNVPHIRDIHCKIGGLEINFMKTGCDTHNALAKMRFQSPQKGDAKQREAAVRFVYH